MNHVIVYVCLIGLLAGCENGSYFDPATRQLHSDKVGRIEATGEDLRAYEFTPQTDSRMQCVFVAGTAKGGMFCWVKEVNRVGEVPK